MSSQGKRIGVVGLPGGWSSELLLKAVIEHGCRGEILDPGRLELDLVGGGAFCQGEDLSGFDALILKKMGQAYGPDLLDRLDLLRFQLAQGTPIFSDPGRVQGMLNRLQCTLALGQADVPMPATAICQTTDQALDALGRLGSCVVKPLYSTKAKGMRMISPGPGAAERLEQYRAQGHGIIYLQQLLRLPGHDLGVVFLGGRHLCTYARGARDFLGQGEGDPQGGRYFAYQPSTEVLDLAQRAQDVFGLDFTCVDIVESEQGPLVLEVSAFGGFRGIWEANGINAAQLYVDHVLKVLR